MILGVIFDTTANHKELDLLFDDVYSCMDNCLNLFLSPDDKLNLHALC